MEHRIQVPADWESINQLMAFTDEVEQHLPLSDDQSYLARLVIEEIATNIVKYGYEHDPGVIQVSCDVDDGTFRLIIRDDGRPFDPRTSAAPDMSDDPQTRSVGGLGLFLVRDLSDSLSYHHDTNTGWNELVVLKHREHA